MRWDWINNSYHQEIVAPGKQPIFLLLVGLVLGFGFIRTSTRLIRAQVSWWPGNVSAGGVHLHHEFFGVLIMLVTGTLEFTLQSNDGWDVVLALAFGVGSGLVLDEFALLLHLEDVYWTKQGQSSIDAVIAAVIITGMLVVRVSPFGLDDGVTSEEITSRWLSIVVIAVFLALTIICALKGKPWLALLSVVVPVIGVVGAIRLASPESPWARRRYAARTNAMQKSIRRGRRWTDRKERLVTRIGGVPNPTVAPTPTGTPNRSV
jgi:hypothetical protein